MGDVHGHGAHPEEKADESVLSAVAKKDAKSTHRFQLRKILKEL